jgi:16S rRNA (cytidine1402-2'-O)-methyltransferase
MGCKGALRLVATPIGNLGDISPNAAAALGGANFIAAEDTRVTVKLLNYLNIKKPLVSYHAHSGGESGERILERILAGENCVLVTDAGMPGISDPGEELVALCAGAGVEVTATPGPCAAVTALALSGLPSGRFVFEGFLSTARRGRTKRLEELQNERRTMVFYEAPHKLRRTLGDMLEVFGDRRASISRELTKLHEETLRMTLSEALEHYGAAAPRGEFVIVVEGAPNTPRTEETDREKFEGALVMVEERIRGGASLRDAARLVSEQTGVPRKALYDGALTENGGRRGGISRRE